MVETTGISTGAVPTSASRSATLIMDLAALGDDAPHTALAGLAWPSDYDAYHAQSRTIIDAIAGAARQGGSDDNPAGAVMRAKTYDIVTDLAFIARLAFDIGNARAQARVLHYDPRTSPLLAYLDAGEAGAAFTMPRIWHHRVDPRLATRARKMARRLRSRLRATMAGDARVDIHNRNNLVNAVLAANGRNGVDWPVTDLNWTDGAGSPPILADGAATLVEAYNNCTAAFIDDDGLCATVAALGKRIIDFHLAKAWTDLQLLERHIRRRPMAASLLSGTPKHLGRLAGWLYRRDGRAVMRCAHGGERVFYDDYEWGLAEFSDCNIYYAHSAGERDALARRLARAGTAMVDPGRAINFRTIGSPHHQQILERSRRRGRGARSGTVLYVAGGYLGEQLGDFPHRKPPDLLYLDWQIDLIDALKSLGYCVAVKPHPGGVAREAGYLARYGDEIVEGSFDPVETSADCLIFDFAGTAFVDALASETPMVLADNGVRPFDATTRDELARRCAIVAGGRDGQGRFRIDRDALGNAVETAITAPPCSPAFYDRYLGP